MKVALNPPSEVDVTVATVEASKVIAIVEIGTNPLPVTVTKVATVPEVGSSEMVGLRVLPDVEKFHSQLSSTPSELEQSKWLPSSSWMFDNNDAM